MLHVQPLHMQSSASLCPESAGLKMRSDIEQVYLDVMADTGRSQPQGTCRACLPWR
jgi:hypothetical protein